MKALLPLLLVFVVVGSGWYMWTRDDPIAPTKSTDQTPGPAPEAAPPSQIVTLDSGDTTPLDTSDANKAGGTKPKAVIPPKAPQSEFARRAGLSEEMAEKVRIWHRKLALTQSQFGNELEDGADGPLVAKEFNTKTAKQRKALIALIGVESANKALIDLPVYEFDLTGSWHRVDAEGRPSLFTDPNKEDIWRNFQRKRRQP